MLQTIAGSWPIAVMFIATLAALLALRIMRMVEKHRSQEQEIASRSSQPRAFVSRISLIALCAASLLVHANNAIAADKPVPPLQYIGAPIGSKPQKRETDEQYIRRVSKPAPGKLE